ncbi:FAD-dependent oxidoreductase [Deferrisoma camini]|uniref:FAD-dependent oxidoreductase n=1 Tax=Deferrisoma camini TaxID=1035120 RepID=UPI0004B9ABBA|nr:FAD-dependent oxidoreductase [Deferrisoma camini]
MIERVVDPVCGKPVENPDTAPSTECRGETVYFCSVSCREKFVCEPTKRLTDYLFDVIIIGGGPAGISAGIYAALTGLDTLFLTKSLGGQAWDSTAIVNYPGFDLITGPELVDRFQKQLFESLKLSHQICGVTSVEKHGGVFEVRTDDDRTYRSRTVILATGMKRRRLGIPGEQEFLGRGVLEFHALAANRYDGTEVAVVGGGNSAAQAALGLAEEGARVTLVTRSYRADEYLKEKVAASDAIVVLQNRTPLRIEGTDRAEVLVVRNQDNGAEEVLPVEAVFVEIGLVPNSDLVRDLVHVNERGEVEIDGNCRTGLPGLYAAGDVTNTFGKRILIAAGEGAKAVLAIEQFLKGRKS